MTSNALEPIGKTLPEPVARRGITEAQWRTLKGSLYPGALSESVLAVWDYCVARRLDPLKRPVHIVPMEVKIAGSNRTEWRDVVMPSIYEARVSAHRTGLYLGHSEPDYGPEITVGGVKAPEWCAMTFYRQHGEHTVPFPVKTKFREVVATTKDGKPNARWSRAPTQMLTKCCEAAGLREAFPDELGGEHVVEELEGKVIDAAPVTDDPVPEPDMNKPADFEAWLDDLRAVADNGLEVFASVWQAATPEHRGFLTATQPDTYEQLKARATAITRQAAEEGETE
jgi:phage recombination protein Bet